MDKELIVKGVVSEPRKSEVANAAGEGQASPLSPSLNWRAEFQKERMPTKTESTVAIAWCILGFIPYTLAAWVFHSRKSVPWEVLGLLGFFGTVTGIVKLVSIVIRQHRGVTKPFRPFCPHCGKYIPSELEWMCGFCDKHNINTNIYSFLYKCERCEATPKAYRCHHQDCGEDIFLDADNDATHRATMFKEPMPEEAKPIAQLRQEELDEIAFNKARATELSAQLDAELDLSQRQWRLEQSKKARQSQSSGSELEQSFEAHWDRHFEIHRIAASRRKKAERAYADDPEMLGLALMAIENWVAKQLGEVE